MHGVNHWTICCHPKAPVLCTGFYHWTTSCYSSALLKYFVEPAICFFLSVFFYQKKCLCTWKHKKQQCNLHARCEPLAHLLSSQSSSTVYNLKIRFFWKKGLCDDKHNKTATQIKCITVSLMGTICPFRTDEEPVGSKHVFISTSVEPSCAFLCLS